LDALDATGMDLSSAARARTAVAPLPVGQSDLPVARLWSVVVGSESVKMSCGPRQVTTPDPVHKRAKREGGKHR
jgi:hypothetical protein